MLWNIYKIYDPLPRKLFDRFFWNLKYTLTGFKISLNLVSYNDMMLQPLLVVCHFSLRCGTSVSYTNFIWITPHFLYRYIYLYYKIYFKNMLVPVEFKNGTKYKIINVKYVWMGMVYFSVNTLEFWRLFQMYIKLKNANQWRLKELFKPLQQKSISQKNSEIPPLETLILSGFSFLLKMEVSTIIKEQ